MFTNKTIVLTGANGGIGSEIATLLSKAGAILVLVGLDEMGLQQLNQRLGGQHHTIQADISTSEGRQSIVTFCQHLKEGVDIVINNMSTASSEAILSAQSGDSHISCTDLLTKSDDEIIKMSFSKIKREEKARVAEILQEKFGGPGLEIDKVNKIKSDVNSVMDFVINQGLIDGKKSGLNTAVHQMREKCRLEKEGQSELNEYSSEEYEVILENPK